MGYNFRNLDGHTRALMVEEIASDIACSALRLPHRLNPEGVAKYPGLLRAAAMSGNEETLAAALRAAEALKRHEMRRFKIGVNKTPLPENAAEMLAEEEFNHFYVRALCRIAIEKGSTNVIVYRAKASADASADDPAIGKELEAARLLADLRNSVDLDSALGLSSGRHPGLTVATA